MAAVPNPHRYLNDFTAEMDRLPCAHPSSVNPEVAALYYSLVRNLRPRLIVEIGCFIGFSTQHLAQGLADNGFGECLSIDMFDFAVDAGRGPEDRLGIAMRYLERAGHSGRVRLVKGHSVQVRAQLAESIRERIDLLYVDGDHSIPGVFADFNAYYGDVRRGGYVILHDIYPEMCGCAGPRALIEALHRSGAAPRQVEIAEIPTRDGYGIALLRKTGTRPLSLRPSLGGRLRWFLRRRWSTGREPIPVAVPMVVRVVDADTGAPLAGATVACPQLPVDGVRQTDVQGRAALGCGRLLPYRYVLDVSAADHETQEGVMLDLTFEPRDPTLEVRLRRRSQS